MWLGAVERQVAVARRNRALERTRELRVVAESDYGARAGGVRHLRASSFAVRLAEQFGVTLIGFLRGERFNVYTRRERIAGLVSIESPRQLLSRAKR